MSRRRGLRTVPLLAAALALSGGVLLVRQRIVGAASGTTAQACVGDLNRTTYPSGFAASDLAGALEEAHAVAKGTQCKQFLFSLSLNPPKDAEVGIDAFDEAAMSELAR